VIDKALLAKIRKCLALAASANEHEAAAALAKARTLMEEHGVTEAQLAMVEIEEATARSSRTIRPLKWETYVCRMVERALGVVSFIDAVGDRTFIGRGPTAEIATYAFAFLFRRLKAARAEYIRRHLKRCRPGRKRQRADVFCEAWALAVFRKVAALAPEREPDGLIEQYLTERHPGLVNINARGASMKGRSTWNDFSSGSAAGRAVDLNHGVGAGSAPLALA